MLVAPFGPGCYDIRHNRKKVCCGSGGHVAQRMTSLLPPPLGAGTRNNSRKRQYVEDNIAHIEYRTFACGTVSEAKALEAKLRAQRGYLFPT